jgi:hypothetical protein
MQNLKINSNSFKPVATSYKNKGAKDFSEFITELVKSFQIKLKHRSIKIASDIKLSQP